LGILVIPVCYYMVERWARRRSVRPNLVSTQLTSDGIQGGA
jgi:hypothetical protein